MGTCTKLPLLFESAQLVVDNGRQRWNGNAGIVRSAANMRSHGWELVVPLRRIANVNMKTHNIVITTAQEPSNMNHELSSVFADVQRTFELHFDSEAATRSFHDNVQQYLAKTNNECKAEHLYFKFDAFDLVKVRGVINIKIGSLGAADYYKAVNDQMSVGIY
jgi:hypothetical protein